MVDAGSKLTYEEKNESTATPGAKIQTEHR